MFLVKIETFFMEPIFLPLSAHWSCHVDVLIFRIGSINVLEQCHEHFAVIGHFAVGTNPFDPTLIISFLKLKENEIS